MLKNFIKRGTYMIESYGKEVSESDIKLLVHKILPEIKKYFADEKIQKEYEQWVKEKEKSSS